MQSAEHLIDKHGSTDGEVVGDKLVVDTDGEDVGCTVGNEEGVVVGDTVGDRDSSSRIGTLVGGDTVGNDDVGVCDGEEVDGSDDEGNNEGVDVDG